MSPQVYEQVERENLDPPHALLNRIRAARYSRGERPLTGLAGRKIMQDFSRTMTAAPGQKVRRYRSENSDSQQLGGYSGAGPSARDPQPLAGLLGRVIAERGWATPLAVSSVIARWDELVGERLASKTKPLSFEEGVLLISCESSNWAVHLGQMKQQIIQRLNQELGQQVVLDLKIQGPHRPNWQRGRMRVAGGRGPRDTYG